MSEFSAVPLALLASIALELATSTGTFNILTVGLRESSSIVRYVDYVRVQYQHSQ
jgi:hypothetical protein